MLADEASGVFTIRAGLGTKTRGVGREVEGEVVLFQDLVHVNVGHRDLCRGYQVVVPVLQLEQVFLEFR